MKVAIYCRVSTEEQNAENQLKDCISINSYGEYKLIEDKQSAWDDSKEREGFKNILSEIKGKRLDHLIVWDLDRIYRNRKRLIGFFELCGAYNCKVHSYRQKFLDDVNKVPEPWNEIVYGIMLQLFGYMAEDESNKKSDRVKAAVRKKGNTTYSYKGKKWGRRALSTYKKNKIIELGKKGNSIRKIANELNISIGVVHKTLQENIIGKRDNGGVQE